jgi:hypothetical protein
MWKIVVGFVVFAALALLLLTKGGNIDMSGEKHGSEEPPAIATAAATAPASAASN